MIPLKTLEEKADFVRVDNFGKIYLIRNNEVFLYSPDGKLLSRNSNNFLGNITDLDATNGLEVLVFFEDQLQVLFLDNQLALRGRDIPLDELGFVQVSQVCTSHGNGIWLFDKTRFELIRLDKSNQHIARSGDLNQLLGFIPEPIYMREINNWLYVVDPDRGVLVFDIFGAYYKTIPICCPAEIQVKDGNLIYYSTPYLINFNLTTLDSDTVMHFEEENQQILLTKNRINILNNSQLNILKQSP
ncbi:hypothetical protein KFE98_10195 [bacterium SCSIO 12741]|nr:hypothetical protein KFE98_10195 [bacterium SCSIO 12741]